MKYSISVRQGLVAIAVCAMTLGTLGSVKHPVERSVKGRAYTAAIVDVATGEFVSCGEGVAGHTGRFTSAGSGNLYTSEFGVTVTAANGDSIHYEATGLNSAVATGGTGRFDGATGAITWTISNESISYPDANTMIYSYTYVLDGTVTY